MQNWVTDTVVRLVESEHYAGRVHHGFASVLRRSWDQVEEILEQVGDRPLFLTGHSMGGALAVLTACRLAAAGKRAVATYTYGSPRVGDALFCNGYDLPTYRVVNRLDLVPEIPFASVTNMLPKKPRLTNEKILGKLHRLAERVPSYAHVNTLVYIDRDGTISEGKDVAAWGEQAVRRALQTRGKSFVEGITDHLLSNYIRALDERG